MHDSWLQGVYDDYRQGDSETVRGVRTLQKKVAIGCATPRDVAVLKGLDRIHIGADVSDPEASVQISDALLHDLLDLIAQARRPARVNLMAQTQRMRQGGTGRAAIAGYYDSGPFFGARGGGGGRAVSAPSHAHGGTAHHGTRHRPGGGFASWVGPWGVWPDDCYADVYGRIWCWGPFGWQVVG